MKRTFILSLCFVLAALSAFASTILPPYDNTKPPGLSLPAAYDRALTALGSDTNQFHCLSATIGTEFAPEGEWHFSFCSTNSKVPPKLIVVEFSGKVIFDNGYR